MPGKLTTPKTVAAAKAVYVQAVSETGRQDMALARADIAKSTVHNWRKADPEFNTAVERAIEEACDLLEDEAVRRGVHGVEEPVFQGGKQVGLIRKYSDTLLMFILNGRRPECFKHRHEHTGAGGKPLIPTVRELTDDELLAIVAAGGRGPGTAPKKESPPVAGSVH